MRRKLIPFLCVLLGCYVGLGLLLRGLTAHERHANDLEHQTSPLFSPNDPPLLVAVVQGSSVEVARLLQTGTDPDRADRAGRTPLIAATRAGDLETVTQLIKAGAHVDVQDKTGTTPLVYAVKNVHRRPLAALLLAHGADPKHKNRAGESPLSTACDAADTELIKSLLARGAEANARDGLGLTPLMHVARGMPVEPDRHNIPSDPGAMRPEAIRLLLQHNADVRLRDKQGWTALLYASQNEPPEAVQMLLQHGAESNITVKGRTALRNAAYRGLVGNLQALLAHGAKVGPEEFSDAMMQATLAGQDAAVRFLLDKGANANFSDQYGMTPLMLAIANDHLNTARLLVQRGANPRLRDLQGKTALDYAPRERSAEIHTEVFGDMRLRRF